MTARLKQLGPVAGIWLVLALVTATQVVVGMRSVGMQHRWGALFFTVAAGWLIWALATPVVLWLGARFPVTGSAKWKNLPRHIAAALAIGAVDAAWSGGLVAILNPLAEAVVEPLGYLVITSLYSRFHIGLLIYAGILAVQHTFYSMRQLARREAEAARLSAELSRAKMDSLRRQLEPHFLFNTLNGIAATIRDNRNEVAISMIAALSDLLRRLLEDSSSQVVPLAEELSFLDTYAELQSMRFGDRLKVVVDIPMDLYGALVPVLILQPLVENAIVHGVANCEQGGVIRVSARVSRSILTLSVHNDGPSVAQQRSRTGAGLGLSNTRGRLATLYGDSGSLELVNHTDAGVESIVRVPYTVAP